MPAPAPFLQAQSGITRISDGNWVSRLASLALCSSLKWPRHQPGAFPSSQKWLFSLAILAELLEGSEGNYE